VNKVSGHTRSPCHDIILPLINHVTNPLFA
jgi:hypothetical protein